MTQFSGRNDLDVHNRLSRRSFIQIAGAATFGIAAASALGCAPTTEMAGTGESEAPAEEYDMVIVGAGGRDFRPPSPQPSRESASRCSRSCP